MYRELRHLVLAALPFAAGCGGSSSAAQSASYCDGISGSCLALLVEGNQQYAALRVRASLRSGSVPMYTAEGAGMAQLPLVIPLQPPPGVTASQIQRLEVQGLRSDASIDQSARFSINWPDGEHITATTRLGLSSLYDSASTQSVTASGYPFLSGDFNHDNHADLLVRDKSTLRVALGNGAGGFTAMALSTTFPFSISKGVTGDFNGDGRSDVAAVPSSTQTAAVSLAGSDGSLAAPGSVPLPVNDEYSLAAGDFNADGKTDLVCSGLYSKTVTLYLATGNGSFTKSTSATVSGQVGGVIVGDVNGNYGSTYIGWGAATCRRVNHGCHNRSDRSDRSEA